MKNIFKGKRILVTGGTGSIGSEIVRQLLKKEPEVIRVYSRDETKQYDMQQELSPYKKVIRYFIGDVRDKQRLLRAMEDVEIVFHAAALKHVPACEYNPFEAVKTNIMGTQNLIECALDQKSVERVVGVSTDKATSPTNTMGATKLVSERLLAAADFYKGKRSVVFTAIRFGNVMGSRGSIIPLFKKQIASGGPVTVTDPEMTRFIMSIREAVELVFKAAGRAKGGEIFILKMPAFRIIDLAEVMIEELAEKFGYKPHQIKIKIIGLRPGEKIYEDLMTEEEAVNSYEMEDMFIIKSPVREKPTYLRSCGYGTKDERVFSKKEIKEFLYKENLL